MKVTLKSIADRAGVSVNTVSLALRNMPGVKSETKSLIHQLAEEMGYFERKARSEPHNICLVSTGERLRDSYFYMSFYQQILNKVQEFGYNMLVFNTANCEIPVAELKRNFTVNSVCGIILLGDMDERVAERVASCGIPTVAIGTRYHRIRVCTFIEDNLEGAYLAVSHLHRRGYRRIGFVGSPLDTTAFMERYQGFVSAMMRHGLPLPREYLLVDVEQETALDFQVMKSRFQKLERLPEAFICCNDNFAMVAAKALHSMGLSIPRDVALIGFDNSTSGNLAIPAITSVDVQCAFQAEESVKKLMRFIAGDPYEIARHVTPMVVAEHESVGLIEADE